ncbi:MAG: hypothetical protein AAB676_12875 [Verrucomicrobiota bacterium]
MSKHRDADWADAQQRCRLSVEVMAMAKELGLNPRSLIKNIPNRSEPWKLPVKDWVQNMYFKRFGNRTPHSSRHEEAHPLTHKENQSLLTSAAARADTQPAAPPPNLLREAENELFRKADHGEVDEVPF